MNLFKSLTKNKRLIFLLPILIALLCKVFIPPKEQIALYSEYFNLFDKHAAKILLVHNGGFGERETIARLKITSQLMNIDLRAVNGRDDDYPNQRKRHIEAIIKVFKPDFVIVQEDMLNYYQGAPNYITLTRGGINRYLTRQENGRFALATENHYKFDALLISFRDIDLVKSAYEEHGKKYFGFEWYPTVYRTEYTPAILKKLFYSGGHLWDTTRGSTKYLELFKKLDQAGYFAVCGVKDNWQHTPNSLIGQLPFDGASVIAKIHEFGASLLLHDKEHLDGASPTARIFEAAAANAVIISDKNAFIVDNFGDNVLYVDIDQSAENLFQQIDKHMQWILTHPHEAAQMAANCHAIYKEKFSLEQQMESLLAMHKEVLYHAEILAKIKPSTEISVKKLPAKIKGCLIDKRLPEECALLTFKGNKWNAFLSPNSLAYEKRKLATILKTIDKIIASGKTIPDGSYLISYADGVHVAYPWPMLAFASDQELVAQKRVVLLPDNEALVGYKDLFQQIDSARANNPWGSKSAKIFWRGQTTGHYFNTDPKKPFPRLSLMLKAGNLSFIDAAFTHFTADIPPTDRQIIAGKFQLKKLISPAESLKFKYLLDVDGHSCAYSRTAWILYSNSVLMKHTSNKVQWYYDKLQPYVNFIPVAADFSDLQQQYAWAETHQNEVQAIIKNGRHLAEQVFAPENVLSATANAFMQYHQIIKDELH